MDDHKFNLGVSLDKPGPQFASFATLWSGSEIKFSRVPELGAFWPLEWRLVVMWTELFRVADVRVDIGDRYIVFTPSKHTE
jgi:hypothetical protein